tara:strand:+ start:401 stop:2581 length:2181 start_codon:yes stop_codon:yes gene_type:complete
MLLSIKKQVFNLTSLLIIISSKLYSQKTLSLDSLWTGKYNPDRLESIRPMKDGESYTILKNLKEINATQIIQFDYKNLKQGNVILDSDNHKEIESFSNYTFSKDEKKILLESNAIPIYRRSKAADYWVFDIATKKLQKISDKKIQEPLLSPDATKVAYVFKRNLFVKDLKSRQIKQLTYDGNFQTINGISDWVYEEEFGFVRAFDWGPDSKELAYMRFDESKVPIFSMDIYGSEVYQFPYMFRYPKAGEENSKVDLYIVNTDTNIRKKIFFKDEHPYYIPRIKFAGGQNSLIIQTMNRHQNHLKIWRWNTINESMQMLLEEKENTYVSIHDNLMFLEDNSFLWTSERDGYNHIYHYDQNGKLINQLTKGKWEVTSLYVVNPKEKELYYQSVESGSTERGVYAVKINGKGKRLIQVAKGTNGASFSANGDYYIHSFSDEYTPPKFSLYQTKKNRLLGTFLDNEKLKNEIEEFQFNNREFSTVAINGEQLNMWMIKPKDFDPSKKYPLLLFQYSGPGSQQVSNRWGDEKLIWHKNLANQGYIIACLDGRGTGFKGAKFKKFTYQNLVKYETLDQIAFAKYLGDLQYIDKSRIGIWGWSFGGHMATHCLLTGNNTFSMAIAVAPVTNWRFYDTIYTERFMRTPQENPEGYDMNSPLNYADQLKGKFLIIHGSADDNVHVQNTMRMVEALIQADKQFEWMIYPDKNHGIFGGKTRKHLYTKMTKFINKNL